MVVGEGDIGRVGYVEDVRKVVKRGGESLDRGGMVIEGRGEEEEV